MFYCNIHNYNRLLKFKPLGFNLKFYLNFNKLNRWFVGFQESRATILVVMHRLKEENIDCFYIKEKSNYCRLLIFIAFFKCVKVFNFRCLGKNATICQHQQAVPHLLLFYHEVVGKSKKLTLEKLIFRWRCYLSAKNSDNDKAT